MLPVQRSPVPPDGKQRRPGGRGEENKARKTEGRRNKTGVQRGGREHAGEEVSDVVCEIFFLAGAQGVVAVADLSPNWDCVETRITFHVLLDDALLWHRRGPLCCEQVMKVGGEETVRLQKRLFTGPSVCSF